MGWLCDGNQPFHTLILSFGLMPLVPGVVGQSGCRIGSRFNGPIGRGFR